MKGSEVDGSSDGGAKSWPAGGVLAPSVERCLSPPEWPLSMSQFLTTLGLNKT